MDGLSDRFTDRRNGDHAGVSQALHTNAHQLDARKVAIANWISSRPAVFPGVDCGETWRVECRECQLPDQRMEATEGGGQLACGFGAYIVESCCLPQRGTKRSLYFCFCCLAHERAAPWAVHTRFISTLMFPRVALEYGHVWCAPSKIDCAA